MRACSNAAMSRLPAVCFRLPDYRDLSKRYLCLSIWRSAVPPPTSGRPQESRDRLSEHGSPPSASELTAAVEARPSQKGILNRVGLVQRALSKSQVPVTSLRVSSCRIQSATPAASALRASMRPVSLSLPRTSTSKHLISATQTDCTPVAADVHGGWPP